MKRRRVGVAAAVWAAALVALALLNAAMPMARAAESPAVQADAPAQNSVEWTVNSDTFESVYPDGFVVTLDATSPAGPIERASLIWNRPTQRAGETMSIFRQTGEIDPASGQIIASWQPDDTMMLPPWSQLAYHWELRDSEGNVLKTDPVVVDYADNTRDWQRSESDDAVVYAEGLTGDIESVVLDAMAEQHDKYVAVWGAPLPYKPRIVLFGDFDAWLEWRTADHNTSETQYVVGQTFDAWGVVAQVLLDEGNLDAAYRDLAYGTVVHEIEHLYQAEYLWPQRRLYDIPGWFVEGDASFFELGPSYDYLGRVQDMARSGQLPPLLVGVSDGPRIDGETPRDGYDIGYSFAVWLAEENGGLEAYNELMAQLADNVPFFDALESVTGMSSVQEIERAWRTWLGASGDAATLVPTWTPAALPMFATPTP
jgi:hypothetical protein